MLKQILIDAFKENNGVIRCSTLRASNRIVFKVTEDGEGFVCDKGPAVFPFDCMDALEHEMQIVARFNRGKVYYGANVARNGVKLGDNEWLENTIDGILARRCFNKQDGDSVYAASSLLPPCSKKLDMRPCIAKTMLMRILH